MHAGRNERTRLLVIDLHEVSAGNNNDRKLTSALAETVRPLILTDVPTTLSIVPL